MKKIFAFFKDFFILRNVPSLFIIGFILIGVTKPDFLDMEPITMILAAIGALSVENIIERLTYLSKVQKNTDETASMVSDIKRAVENVEMEVIVKDRQVSSMVEEIAERIKANEVIVLSSGLTTRQEMIAALVQKGIRVTALIQDPETAPDKMDKKRIETALDWINNHTQGSKLFEPRFHYNVSTVRAIIIHADESTTKHIFLSWYVYENKNTIVRGDTNPTIYCTTESKQGDRIYTWLAKVIEKDLRESREINPTNVKKKKI